METLAKDEFKHAKRIGKVYTKFGKRIKTLNENNEATLRTPAYTAVFVFLTVWTIIVLVYSVGRLTHPNTTGPFSSELCHFLELMIFIIIPLSYILPPLMSNIQHRKVAQIITNLLARFVIVAYGLSKLWVIVLTEGEDAICLLPILIPELFIAVVLFVCVNYLSRTKYRPGQTDDRGEEFWKVQGHIHGAEMVTIAGCGMLAAFNDEIILNNDEDVEDNVMITLHYYYPWFMISFLLLVQLRHFTYVHHDHHTVYSARARSKQFQQQYNMSPLDREAANDKGLNNLCLETVFSSAVYPKCSSSCCDEE